MTEGCPAPERLWDAVAGVLSPEQARVTIAHALSCSDCRTALRIARELRAEAGIVAAPARTGWAPRRKLAIGVAVAVAAAGLTLVPILRRHEPPPATVREAEAPSLIALSAGSLPRDRFLLRWTGPPHARYLLTVTTRDLALVHERSDLAAEEALVPSRALQHLAAGTELAWTL